MMEQDKLRLSIALQEALPLPARLEISRELRAIFECYENEISSLRGQVQRLEWRWQEGTPLPPLQEVARG